MKLITGSEGVAPPRVHPVVAATLGTRRLAYDVHPAPGHGPRTQHLWMGLGRDAHSGLPQVTGQASQEALQAWAAAAKHTDVETARLAQPSLNTFLGITLQGTQTLGQRHYQEFRPGLPPAHFLDAIRLALAASVANQNIEHFWSV